MRFQGQGISNETFSLSPYDFEKRIKRAHPTELTSCSGGNHHESLDPCVRIHLFGSISSDQFVLLSVRMPNNTNPCSDDDNFAVKTEPTCQVVLFVCVLAIFFLRVVSATTHQRTNAGTNTSRPPID